MQSGVAGKPNTSAVSGLPGDFPAVCPLNGWPLPAREGATRKSRFTEAQMVKIPREADRASIPEVTKKHGISEQTIYT